jgi:hypothetical protein
MYPRWEGGEGEKGRGSEACKVPGVFVGKEKKEYCCGCVCASAGWKYVKTWMMSTRSGLGFLSGPVSHSSAVAPNPNPRSRATRSSLFPRKATRSTGVRLRQRTQTLLHRFLFYFMYTGFLHMYILTIELQVTLTRESNSVPNLEFPAVLTQGFDCLHPRPEEHVTLPVPADSFRTQPCSLTSYPSQ